MSDLTNRKVVIFGNSGSGKSTLANEIADAEGLAHLDLDTLAWLPGLPPERKPLAESQQEIDAFMQDNVGWVIEGCYADLLTHVLSSATEVVYMNLSVEDCIKNAKTRPWEPHKYASKEAQDANLDMLIHWIRDYNTRDDVFSRRAHQALYESYSGKKTAYTSNDR